MKLKTILILVVVLAVVGVIFFVVNLPKSPTITTASPQINIWGFDPDNLQNIKLILPREGKSESFVKHADGLFYFDAIDGLQVDPQRWGGGPQLLLSGPNADRLISRGNSDASLAEYGFSPPNLTAALTLFDGTVYNVEVGDNNPAGTTYYVRLSSSRDVYTVDKSWYEVLRDLVLNPPVVPATFVVDRPTVSPTEIPAGGTVTISATVSNTGDLKGNYDVVLYITFNGVTSDTKTQTVTLEPGASQIVTFQVTESTAGTYVASINTRNVTFVVK